MGIADVADTKKSAGKVATKAKKHGKVGGMAPVRIPASPTPSLPEPLDDFVRQVFRENGVTYSHETLLKKLSFMEPAENMIRNHTVEKTNHVRRGDLASLRKLHERGESLDSCNRFGESLVSLAARHGCTEIIDFMIKEAKVNLLVRDDYGRTVLHDALWTPQPNTELVTTILVAAPEFLLVEDIRGYTPLRYMRVEHREAWMQFFEEKKELIVAKLTAGPLEVENVQIPKL